MARERRSWRGFRIAVLVCAVLSPGGAWAKSAALVIGNRSYANLGALEKTIEDAEGYAAVLRRQGFAVTLLTDLDESRTRSAVGAFVESVEPGDVAAFVFSGHGWSSGGVNYLMPVDMPRSGSPSEAEDRSLPLINGANGILDRLTRRGARVRIAIIDACRDNPFSDGSKSFGTRGLARDQRSNGNFIAYSASPGQQARDFLRPGETERYSVFTRVFLPYLEQNLPLSHAMKLTQGRVSSLASSVGHAQNPDYSDGVDGYFCLSGACPGWDLAIAPPPAPPPAPTPQPAPAPAPAAAPARVAPTPPPAPAAEETPAHLLPAPGSLAAEFLERAGAGNAADMFNLGFRYSRGIEGAPQSDAEAVRWWRRAAELGDASAMFNLGLMYRNGWGVAQDEAEAARLYRRAAELGQAEAMTGLGFMYAQGRGGLAQDEAEAVRWWRRAAELGQAIAMFNLGFMSEQGRGGLAQDEVEAVRLYRRAAELGQATAMNNLGLMHEQGRGVPLDLEEARRWYERALASEDPAQHEWAQRALDRLRGK